MTSKTAEEYLNNNEVLRNISDESLKQTIISVMQDFVEQQCREKGEAIAKLKLQVNIYQKRLREIGLVSALVKDIKPAGEIVNEIMRF